MWDYTCYKMGEWTWTEYHSYYCLFQFSENGDTKTVCFSRFCLQCGVFLRNFALGKWFTITVSHIWCEMFSTSIWHSLFPSCESYGQICTRKSETGFPRTSLAPFRTCTYTQVISKRYAEYIWLIYFCGEYYDEDIINIRTSDSVTDMRKREKLI